MVDDFEAFLDDISQCFINRDFQTWRRRLVLPFSFITRDGPEVLKSEEAVMRNFDQYLFACQVMRLDLVDRRVIALEDCNDGTWLGTFETRLLSDGMLATEPYTSTALLIHDDGRFQMTSMLNARGHNEWTRAR
ncbi:MAG: nuclear transport factor 2 family protein [Pseudomonadota bacterium]